MCEPTTILAIGSAVVGHMAQQQQAKAEDKATRNAYAQEQMQSAEKYKQENDQINQQMSQRSREALAERGRLNAAYGEGGLVGGSLDRILNENEFNLGQDISTMEGNRSNLTAQTRMQNEGSRATAQSRFNSTQRPSIIGTGLQIAGSLAGDKKVQKKMGW